MCAKYYLMEHNTELELAWQCIEKTGSHLFLTGKAGTGKTTFLRKLKEQSPKRMIVVAPTGIAAINAGGVTIHSFFQISPGPFVPESKPQLPQSHYRFSKEKQNLIRCMDLLVIDEISMVRADLLDAIDNVLRRYRDWNKPFGGVQVLMIGDLQQLAPVVKDDEWELLGKYYDTPYFFGSLALKKTEYITIQLQKVYRQTDDHFLYLLNRIREGKIDSEVLAELNKRFIPGFEPHEDEGYIRLTTHNNQAQRVNDQQLSLLPGRTFTFRARIEGEFPESAYPADIDLNLKQGAQIMFIKNDSSGAKRYYNGKIGVITMVDENLITVLGKGDSQSFVLDRESWLNSKYKLDAETKEIHEDIEGIFHQYPIRLAWAITIHKSQGLTFERAIIGANTSFAHGQVYVALSRCKTLEGMVLASPLSYDSVINDDSIYRFNRQMEKSFPDQNRLNQLQHRYYYELLCEQFGFEEINRLFSQLIRLFEEFMSTLYPKTTEGYKIRYRQFEKEIMEVSITFGKHFAMLMQRPDYDKDPYLQERLTSGARYFHEKTKEILQTLVLKTKVELDNKELRKRFDDIFFKLKESVWIRLKTLEYTAGNGFTVSGYLKNKANVILSSGDSQPSEKKIKRSKKEQVEKTEEYSDVKHPELYRALIKWRNEEAALLGVPVYRIIRLKTIAGIDESLPLNIKEMLDAPGFSRAVTKKYGDEIIRIVKAYVAKKGLSPDKTR